MVSRKLVLLIFLFSSVLYGAQLNLELELIEYKIKKMFLSDDGKYFGFECRDKEDPKTKIVKIYKKGQMLLERKLNKDQLRDLQFEIQENVIVLTIAHATKPITYSYTVLDTNGTSIFSDQKLTAPKKIKFNMKPNNQLIAYIDYDYDILGNNSLNKNEYIEVLSKANFSRMKLLKMPSIVREATLISETIIWLDEMGHLIACDLKGNEKWRKTVEYKKHNLKTGYIKFGSLTDYINKNLNSVFILENDIIVFINNSNHEAIYLNTLGEEKIAFSISEKTVDFKKNNNLKAYRFGYQEMFFACYEKNKYVGIIDENVYINNIGHFIRDFTDFKDINVKIPGQFKWKVSMNFKWLLAFNSQSGKLVLFQIVN